MFLEIILDKNDFSAISTKLSVLMALLAINIEIIHYPALCLLLIFNFKYKA
jgi:hypothetical protein